MSLPLFSTLLLLFSLLPGNPMSSNQEQDRGRFVKVYVGALPQEALHAGGPLALYLVLLGYADAQGHCYPGEGALALALDQSPSNIRRHAARLEAMGLIERPRQGARIGRENPYRVFFSPAETSRNSDRALRADLREDEGELRADLHTTSRNSDRALRADLRDAPHDREPRNKSQYLEPSTTPQCNDSAAPSATGLAREVVVGKLCKAGVHPESANRLLIRFPNALEKASRWADWLPTVRRGMEAAGRPIADDENYLGYHLAGRCHQHPTRPCVDPLCDTPGYVLKARPTAVAVRPTAVAAPTNGRPDPETAILPEAADVWKHLLATIIGMPRAMLMAATAVLVDGYTLVIELPATNAGHLQPRREEILTAAQQIRPELVDLRFDTTGGRNA